MLKRHAITILTVCLFAWVSAQTDFVFAGGLDKYLENQRLVVRGVTFVPVTLRDGMESQRPSLWPLKNPAEVFQNFAYLENKRRALKAGVDLKEKMDAYFAAGYKNNTFFLLFYNFAAATGCRNDYLVQRIKLRKWKLYYDHSGAQYKDQEYFLVEAMKLNDEKETQKADEHRIVYSLGKAFKRKAVVDLEIGCGEIPGAVEGEEWPYEADILYSNIQDYSDKPGLYNEVVFDFSSKYRFTLEFDREGNYAVDLPDIPR